ncbi:MAG: dicarboxylate/amino acid:cation symporter [Bacteroidales bacterium]|nr:dicarboxylate/amino acid:cation symporter [Bacteroidales bacterium]MDT8431142.1 dicarboxylate/amino acid:cation symporter [Bacteroidales bacterium]
MKRGKYTLTVLVFAGFFLGILAGWLAGESIVPWATPMKELFLRLLKMAILPLVITSIVSAVVKVGSSRGLGRITLRTITYYLSTSLLAILTGQVLVNIFKPGVGVNLGLEADPDTIGVVEKGIGELILDIIPENVFAAMARGDVLPVIFFSILFGFFVTQLQEKKRVLLGDFFQAGFESMMKLTLFVIWTAPVGVFGIVAIIVAETGFDAFVPLGKYFLIVLAGLSIHFLVTLPLILKFVGKTSPATHYRGMVTALLTAFSTCSTIVTLPFTMKAVTEHSGASEKAAGFVLPIGATVNMDGTALYECVATIFIAQVYGFDLTLAQNGIIVITAILASIGAASIPMSGLVMMSIILNAVGLPLEGIGIILAVDRILDMFRTTVNVFSDSVGAVVISKLEGDN